MSLRLQDVLSVRNNRVVSNMPRGTRGIIALGQKWCGYCQKNDEVLDTLIYLRQPNISVLKFWGDDPETEYYYKLLTKAGKLNGFPTIYIFNGNRIKEYNGKRDVASYLKAVTSF